jgi:hypothetical protein
MENTTTPIRIVARREFAGGVFVRSRNWVLFHGCGVLDGRAHNQVAWLGARGDWPMNFAMISYARTHPCPSRGHKTVQPSLTKLEGWMATSVRHVLA